MRNDGWTKPVVAVAVVASLLVAGCAEAPDQQAAAPQAHRHISPPTVEPPVLPAGSFDQAKEAELLSAARSARQAGRTDEARTLAEQAIDAWPGDKEAWQELEASCQALSDQRCQRYAAFFQAKIDYLSGLPTRAAVLGFQSLAEEPEGTATSEITLDRKALTMARRMWAFYGAQDPMKDDMAPPQNQQTFSEEYPYIPPLIVAGVVGGVLTLANSIASK